MLDEGRTGLLLPADEPEAWSSALIGVLDDPGFARRLGGAARQRIEAEFALPVVVDRYVALYRKLLAGTWPHRDLKIGPPRLIPGISASSVRTTWRGPTKIESRAARNPSISALSTRAEREPRSAQGQKGLVTDEPVRIRQR